MTAEDRPKLYGWDVCVFQAYHGKYGVDPNPFPTDLLYRLADENYSAADAADEIARSLGNPIAPPEPVPVPPTTRTISNGSKWMGQEPDTIDELVATLGRFQIDRDHFREIKRPVGGHPGFVRYLGNFIRVSHVFNIETNDPEVISRLDAAISENESLPYDDIRVFYDMKITSGPREGLWSQVYPIPSFWVRRAVLAESRRKDKPISDGVERVTMEEMQSLANSGQAVAL